MKKIFLLLCFLGIALPYYNLYKYLEQKNWEWSLTEFFAEANSNYASSMLSADLGVAALTGIPNWWWLPPQRGGADPQHPNECAYVYQLLRGKVY